MSNLSTRSIITIFFVLLGISLASSTFALELDYPSWFPIKEGMRMSELVLALFNVFLVVAGVAAFIMLMVAGIRYLTSIGNPGVAADARNQASSALLGLALLLASYLILTTLNPELVTLKEPTLTPISPAVYAPANKIVVQVEKPKEEKKEYDIGSGQKDDITLQGSLKLYVNTEIKKDQDKEFIEVWLQAKKKTGDDWWPPDELGTLLRVNLESTIPFDKLITVPADVEGFDAETAVPVKFTISVGRKLVDKVVLSWSAFIPGYKTEGQETIDIVKWEKTYWSVLKITVEPTAVPSPQLSELKLKATLCVGLLPVCIWSPSEEITFSSPQKKTLLDEKKTLTIKGIPLLGDLDGDFGVKVEAEWKKQ